MRKLWLSRGLDSVEVEVFLNQTLLVYHNFFAKLETILGFPGSPPLQSRSRGYVSGMKSLSLSLTQILPPSVAERFGKGLVVLGLILCLALPSGAQTQTAPVRLHGFQQVNTPGDFGPFDELFATTVRDYTTSGAPTPDYVVVKDIAPFDASSAGADPDLTSDTFLFGTFNAYADGIPGTSEKGALVMNFAELPSLPEVDSDDEDEIPVYFGVIQRSGSVASAPKTSLNAFYENGTGQVEYETTSVNREATFTFDTSNDGELTGETELVVTSSELVQVDRLSTGIYDLEAPYFGSVNLFREGILYSGLVTRVDQPGELEWFDRRGMLSVQDTTDSDGDLIPDFSDLGTTLTPFFAGTELGNQWYYSSWMKSAVLPTPQSWYLTTAHQWLYAPNGQSQGVWFYSQRDNLKWFWTREDLYPYLYRADTNTFVYYHWEDANGDRMVSNGEAHIYDYEKGEWEAVAY